MQLKELLTVIDVKILAEQNCEIKDLAIDSRKVKAGDLFFAYKGAKDDGCKYIDDAIKNGAVAVLFDSPNQSLITKYKNLPLIHVNNLPKKIGKIAAKFFKDPTANLDIIGVTGTNGKTSISQFIATILHNLQIPCGVIGTLGDGFPGKLTATKNTTPDPITLQRQFHDFQNADAKAVAMEVSSHAIAQDRIANIKFKTAVFTNLTRDHLDYHFTMENYYLTKKQLFLMDKLENAVINLDDAYGRRLFQELQIERPHLNYFCYSINNSVETRLIGSLHYNLIFASNIKLNSSGITAKICKKNDEKTLQVNLIGRFNLSNLLAVLAVLLIEDIDLDAALTEIKKLKPVIGRMQTFGGVKKPLVVVDFAHTPDALEKALSALREHCKGALWCVFGCGGDRDAGKRPLMGQIAERLSDNIIITDDNPRSEDPKKIVDDILQGLLCPWAIEVEHDRRVAITHAIDCAQSTDVILIAGKGHENYQIIGDEKIPFSDIEVVENVLK